MLLDAWKELDFDLQLYLLICNHCSYIACGITIGISKVFHVLNGLRRIISVSVLIGFAKCGPIGNVHLRPIGFKPLEPFPLSILMSGIATPP